MPRKRWITSAEMEAQVRAEQDRYDREVLGIEPLPDKASKCTKEQRQAYWRRREEAMKRIAKIDRAKPDKATRAARERQRASNIRRAEETREALGGTGTGGES